MELKFEMLFQEVVKELKSLFSDKLSEVILYGSYARGDYSRESDIDIIALIDEESLRNYHKEILRINVDLSLKYDIELSIVIKNKSDFYLNKEIIPLYRNVKREGINLYAA